MYVMLFSLYFINVIITNLNNAVEYKKSLTRIK